MIKNGVSVNLSMPTSLLYSRMNSIVKASATVKTKL